MRAGCGGCLLALGLLLVLVGALAGGFWAVDSALATPPLPAADVAAGDGSRALQKLREVARGRRGSVTLTDREINALLARHLAEAPEVLLAGPVVRIPGNGQIEVVGRLTLGHTLEAVGFDGVASRLPSTWAARPLWVTMRATAHVRRTPRPHLRLDVDRLALGRLPLPGLAARVLLDPATAARLRWPLPDHVRDVTLEPGRAVIRLGD
ncbi:MAG TPA: hypothetical protein VNN07_09270 [Candidatus Tectomicrobia bacterium]|nr:hypothetical protein [Candidatus Tectomicrobia bacterium]